MKKVLRHISDRMTKVLKHLGEDFNMVLLDDILPYPSDAATFEPFDDELFV